jgi:hypothetical protein
MVTGWVMVKVTGMDSGLVTGLVMVMDWVMAMDWGTAMEMAMLLV